MHSWHVGGSLKNYVEHSSRDDCTGSDSGGGMEAVLGPFASTAAALEVAMALNHGYGAGRLDGRTTLLEQQARDAAPVTRRHYAGRRQNGPDPCDPTSDDGTVARDGLDMPSYGG